MIGYIVLLFGELHQFVILWILHLLKPPLPSRCFMTSELHRPLTQRLFLLTHSNLKLTEMTLCGYCDFSQFNRAV